MFMDDESLSKPKPTRKVLKAPSKIVDGDEGDEDDDEEWCSITRRVWKRNGSPIVQSRS